MFFVRPYGLARITQIWQLVDISDALSSGREDAAPGDATIPGPAAVVVGPGRADSVPVSEVLATSCFEQIGTLRHHRFRTDAEDESGKRQVTVSKGCGVL